LTMLFHSWLRTLRTVLTLRGAEGKPVRVSRRRDAKRRPSTSLTVERLEDRTVPSAGALDPTFGVGGKVTTGTIDDFCDEGPGSVSAAAVAIQPVDGKIVVVGTSSVGHHSFAVARYNPDGSLDNTFGTNGKVDIFTIHFDAGGNLANPGDMLPDDPCMRSPEEFARGVAV